SRGGPRGRRGGAAGCPARHRADGIIFILGGGQRRLFLGLLRLGLLFSLVLGLGHGEGLLLGLFLSLLLCRCFLGGLRIEVRLSQGRRRGRRGLRRRRCGHLGHLTAPAGPAEHEEGTAQEQHRRRAHADPERNRLLLLNRRQPLVGGDRRVG